jgi:type IV pilus assembly protein PilM
MLSALGLSPERIDAEPVACFRAFDRWLRRDSDENTVSVILDIGYEASRILVAKGREILFIKVIDIGGRKFTETASKQLNMSFEEAAELRNLITRENAEESDPELAPKGSSGEGSGSVSWTIHDAVRGEIEALAREVSLCLRYCAVTFRGLRPQQVTVVGGQAYDPSVVKLLSEDLNIECVIGQPLRGVDISHASFGGNRRGMLAEWSVCMGLACKSIEKQKSKVGAYNEYHRLPA